MTINRPWVTVREAMQTFYHCPVDPKVYDFAEDMLTIYQAVPVDSRARNGLVSMLTTVFIAGEISGKRKERARRRKDATI